jgi:DmsE family decaheme c-type cytochrome
MSFRKALIGLVSGVVITLWAATARAADDPAGMAPIYSENGSKTCLKCHDDPHTTAVLKTPHGVTGDSRTPAAIHGCESCHGPSGDHAASHPAPGQKRVPTAVSFSGPTASPVEERNAVCLTCHETSDRMNWRGSQHASNDVACSTCHTVHATKDPVLVKETQPDKCFTCHAEQRAQSFQRSHHPVREGKVSCSDCHNVHGSNGPKLVKEFTINDTCYNCHAEKRGPMLFEHEPVRENCDNCHNPHGTSQAALLTERMPFLCSSCHSGSASNHSGAFIGGKMSLPGQSKNNFLISNELQARSCLNCHSAIHGSNSPSGEVLFR